MSTRKPRRKRSRLIKKEQEQAVLIQQIVAQLLAFRPVLVRAIEATDAALLAIGAARQVKRRTRGGAL